MSNAIRNSFVALAAILAFAGTSFEAQAQRAAQSRSAPTGSTGTESGGGGGQVLLLGQPGNCPPTIACAPQQPRQPERPKKVKHSRTKQICDVATINSTGERVLHCIDR